YSLGVVLLELLTGRAPELPGPGGRAAPLPELASAYASSRLQGGGVMIRAARAPVSPGLRSILERCLAPDPADRYRRAAELADALGRGRTHRAWPSAREPALRPGPVRWARRQWRALAAGALGLALSAGGTAVVWQQAEAERPGASSSQLIDGVAFRFRRTGQ